MNAAIKVCRADNGKTRWATLLLGCSVLVSLIAPPVASATSLSQGYHSSAQLAAGAIVSLASDSNNLITPADIDHATALLGVVVKPSASTLAITDAVSSVQVATNGSAVALVSDVNGPVKTGDAITISPIKGVGMKATENGQIVGIALEDASTSGETVSLKTKQGKSQSFHMASVLLTVQVAYYVPSGSQSIIPSVFQTLANTVAGKPVSVVRILISSTILLLALAVVGIMLFAAVRSSLAAIGRNPLAKSSIYRGLWQVLGIGCVILIVALSGAYVILVR